MDEVYAWGCLSAWSLPLALRLIARLRTRGAGDDRHTTVFSLTAASFLIFLGVQVVAADNPPTFPAAILSLELMFFCLDAYAMPKGEFAAVLFAFAAGVLLIVAYPVVNLAGGFDGSRAMHNRALSTRAGLVYAVREFGSEQAVYPKGELTPEHPLIKAHPELAQHLTQLHTPVPLWHSFFTNLYRKQPLPRPFYPGGTPKEALDDLRAWFDPSARK